VSAELPEISLRSQRTLRLNQTLIWLLPPN